MTPLLRVLASGGLLAASMGLVNETEAQKTGGVWKIYSPDSPASMSPLEEATVYAVGPMMGVFNNLVLFDQHVKQNSLDSIIPDLAMSWSWNEYRIIRTLARCRRVKWPEGKP